MPARRLPPTPAPAAPAPRRAAPRRAAPRLLGQLELSTAEGSYLGDTRVRLLEAIERVGSISGAARELPLSYKAAWDAVDAMNNLAEQPLVQRSAGGRAGGGTRLTEHGRRVVAMYRALQAEAQQALAGLAPRVGSEPQGDLPGFRRLLRRMALRSSARNQFAGTVAALREGALDVEVQVRVDEGLEIVATVTRESAAQLQLVPGAEVVALVKASAPLLFTDEALRVSARNRLWGRVARVSLGPLNAEVLLDLGRGRSACAVVTRESVDALGLAEGVRACAAFKASSVILVALD